MKKQKKQTISPRHINRSIQTYGTVSEKVELESGSRYGKILGQNGVNYHFNVKALSAGYNWETLCIGDEVSFLGEYTSDNRYQAKSIQLIRSGKQRVVIEEKKEDESINVGAIDDTSLSFYKPGFSQYFDKEKLTQVLNNIEQDTIERLARLLYISNSNTQLYGKDKYPFFLVGATKCTKQFVRGKYEYLLVFSYFENGDWQMKSLQVAKEIRKKKAISERRPLANFYVLVSNARNLLDEVRKTKGRTEAAVIPFSFSEILECQDDNELIKLINERFGEFYFANNLFGETGTIEDEILLFGDRGKIADAIVQRCLEHNHSGIFGLRRSGKSSVLRAVERRLDAQGIKHITVESESELEKISSWHLALYDIARRVRITCSGIEQGADEPKAEYDKRLNLNSTEEDYEKRPTTCFVEDVKKYTRDEETFVIAIDEIELITYNTATTTGRVWRSLEAYSGFWGALRDCKCALIVCGVNSTISETSQIEFRGETCTNPMYQRIHLCGGFDKNYLPAFTDDQTKEMINTLGSFSNIAFDNVYSLINKAFGGQPYAIRQFCAYAFEKVKSNCKVNSIYQLQKAAFDAYLNEFNRSSQGEQLVKTILQHIEIYEKEYRMLKQIALSPDKNRTINSENISLIDHLVKYGIIEYDASMNLITFNIESVRDYIQRNETKELEDMNNTERRQYVQGEVAECEKKLKQYVQNRLSSSEKINDIDQARQILYNPKRPEDSFVILKKEYQGKIDPYTCELQVYFDHRVFAMYFSKLKLLISKYWYVFSPSFKKCSINKERFETYMDDLNAGRTDADHYDAQNMYCPDDWEIDDTTLKKFKIAADEMKRFFSQYGV